MSLAVTSTSGAGAAVVSLFVDMEDGIIVSSWDSMASVYYMYK
jgi:hypothetical protein